MLSCAHPNRMRQFDVLDMDSLKLTGSELFLHEQSRQECNAKARYNGFCRFFQAFDQNRTTGLVVSGGSK